MVQEEVSGTLATGNDQTIFCIADDNARAAIDEDMAGTLKVGGSPPVLCMTGQHSNSAVDVDVCGTLTAHDAKGGPTVAIAADYRVSSSATSRDGSHVRRLTPRECERLQGMPDDWTRVPYRGRPAGECPDGPRYKAIGNSMAVPVMRWIGERVAAVLMLDGIAEDGGGHDGEHQRHD